MTTLQTRTMLAFKGFFESSSSVRRILRRAPLLCVGIIVAVAITALVEALTIERYVFASQSEDKRVLIVSPMDDPNYSRVMRGVKSHYKRSAVSPILSSITVSQLANGSNELLDSVRSLKPDVIITIGSGVTQTISDSISNIPVIFAAVLNPELSGFIESRSSPNGGVTGASLDIPPDVQFKYFKQVAPNLKRLGIIYSEETAPLIPHAAVVAASQGIELLPMEVKPHERGGYERGVYVALDSLLPEIDGLWSLADPNVISPVSVKLIVKRTIRKRIPFMGFSARLVKSGALFALDFDYKDIGRQAGEISEKALSGVAPGSISVTDPGVIFFNYNQKTAKRLSIQIPEELQAIAKEVYR